MNGLSLRRLSSQAVVSGGLPRTVRIAAMPAYHTLFNVSDLCPAVRSGRLPCENA